MRMNRMAALTLSAGMITMAACSDSPTAPTANAVVPKTTSFAVGDITDGPAPAVVTGVIVLCKVGNTGGSFTFTRVGEGSAQDFGGLATDQTLANGKCLEVARDNSPSGSGSQITITEGPAPENTVQTIEACRFRGYDLDGTTLLDEEDCESYVNGQQLFLNRFHGFVVVYRNTYTAPPPKICTYTKGWYQNKNGAPTITLTLDGRVPDDQRTIFAATPGKPNGVTWGTNNKPNNLLNLYQQLLAALNNVDGVITDAPGEVQTAINAAIAGTGGSGLNITTTLSSSEIDALISTLSKFNEGQFTGYPHCGDEILVS